LWVGVLTEIIREIDMSYNKWFSMYEVVNESVDDAALRLNEFRTSAPSSSGLIPDEVKFSSEFASAKRSYDVAFKILQDFNKNSPKEYQRRRSDEWRESKFAANKSK
jgi:hypothetical protein